MLFKKVFLLFHDHLGLAAMPGILFIELSINKTQVLG
uniref:Uncharacterized protein n=1 Tax=Rhizophora mucronata TaxID=61149 RepID=A0A2P2MC66_RHIMU